MGTFSARGQHRGITHGCSFCASAGAKSSRMGRLVDLEQGVDGTRKPAAHPLGARRVLFRSGNCLNVEEGGCRRTSGCIFGVSAPSQTEARTDNFLRRHSARSQPHLPHPRQLLFTAAFTLIAPLLHCHRSRAMGLRRPRWECSARYAHVRSPSRAICAQRLRSFALFLRAQAANNGFHASRPHQEAVEADDLGSAVDVWRTRCWSQCNRSGLIDELSCHQGQRARDTSKTHRPEETPG